MAAGEPAADPEQVDRDAWGARRSVPLAVGELAGINAFVWSYNEFVRGGDFTQVNPRSWWSNLSHGFFFDDNHFSNNMFAHPYHGSLYYSAARSNGLGYWEAAPFAFLGSFMWECCGETHPPAWNDWMATSLGGIAIGEMLYRASSTVLDNEATGSDRTWNEVAGFLVDPVRGFNRLITGRATSVRPNPSSAYDRTPPRLSNWLRAGVRVIGSETTSESGRESFDDATPFLEFDMTFGDPWRDTRHEPFDQFRVGVSVNIGDRKALGRVAIVGNLVTSEVSRSEGAHHLFTVTQHFDYVNNNVVEFGGQAFGAGLLSDWRLSDALALRSDVNLHGYALNAVNSEYAFLAQAPDRERLREYDLGAGAGGWLQLGLVGRGRELVGAGWRGTWIRTLNGSNVNGGDSHHFVQWAWVRGAVPVTGRWGVGADAVGWLRSSYFDQPGFLDVRQEVGRLRLFAMYRTF